MFRFWRHRPVKAKKSAAQRTRHPLHLEILEDRCLLSFLPATNFATGVDPTSVAVGDFNNDGIPDLVVTNTDDATVSVLLGNGDGSFQPPRNSLAGNFPTKVVVGHFTHSGNLDLVLENQIQGTVSVLLGNGDGTFQPPRRPALEPNTPLGLHDLVVGDFSGDGNMDIVGIHTGVGLTLLQGKGDGTFQARTVFRSNFESFESLAAADVLGHGHLDLVTIIPDDPVSRHPTLEVFPGNGDGTFGAPIKTDLGPRTFPFFRSLLVGDLNGDGRLDVLAIENGGSNLIHALLGNGDGTFRIGPTTPTPSLLVPTSAVLADFNNHGIPDLALAAPADDIGEFLTTVSVLQGNGDGTFQAPATLTVDQGPTGLAAGDLRGNGTTDLVSSNTVANDVSVLLNAGDAPTPPPSGSADAGLFDVAGSEPSLPTEPVSATGLMLPATIPSSENSTLGMTALPPLSAAESLLDGAPALAHTQAVDVVFADLFQPAV